MRCLAAIVALLAVACAAPIAVDGVQVDHGTAPAAIVLEPLEAAPMPALAPVASPAEALFADAQVEPALEPTMPVVEALPVAAAVIAPAPDYLAFRVDDSLPSDEREALAAALASVTERWAQATCMPVRVAEDAPHVVTMRDREDMHRQALGRTEGRWKALRISVAHGYDSEAILLHELAHGIGWTNDHAEVHVDAEGEAHAAFARKLHRNAQITPNDLEVVCTLRACECFQPEVGL